MKHVLLLTLLLLQGCSYLSLKLQDNRNGCYSQSVGAWCSPTQEGFTTHPLNIPNYGWDAHKEI